MLKKYISIIFFVFISSSCFAASNIAILDIEGVLAKSLAAKNAAEQIKKKMEAYQIEINAKSNELKREQNDLVKQSQILTQEVLQAKQKSFVAKIDNLEKEVEAKKKELDQLYVSAISEIEKNIKIIIADISIKQNFNIILAKDEIIYAHEVHDLTEQVVEALNKKITKVELSIDDK